MNINQKETQTYEDTQMNTEHNEFFNEEWKTALYERGESIILERRLSFLNGLTLDIGCGNGEFLEKSKGIGIEMHPLGLKNCKKKGLYVVKANATKMPFKSNSFDSIHTNSVIDHLRTRPEQIEMVNEIKRASKDKSKIYMVVNDISTIEFKYYIDYTHGEPFTKESICSLLKDKKFIIQKTGYIPQIPRGFGRLCYMKKAFEIVIKLYGFIKKRQLEIIAINNKK